MGQPKFPRRKYDTPNHPWQGDRIKSEHELRRKFGLKNKTEIWKAQSRLRQIRGQARELISRGRNPDDQQAQVESKLLLKRLHREGYVGADASLNEVLGLDVERILNRRLQSVVYLKGMARTPKQARQFVSHGLILIGERRVTVPSYVVRREEEEQVVFVPNAAIADPEHPVRPKAPGAEVTAAVTEAKGTGGDEPSEAPTEGDAPVKADAAGTVAPSQGERAEDAEREAGPGKQPPAGEAKEEPKAEPEAKADEAEPKAEPEAKAEPKAEAEPKADEPKADEPKAEPEAKADEPKAEAKTEPKAEATADEPKAEPEAKAKADESKAKAKDDEAKAEPKAEAEPEAKAEPGAKGDEAEAEEPAKKADEKEGDA